MITIQAAQLLISSLLSVSHSESKNLGTSTNHSAYYIYSYT